MDIRKLYKRKYAFEDRLHYINQDVSERWQKLIGFGCGYFSDWSIKGDIIEVGYSHRGDHGVDKIPIEFFEITDADEAKEKYSVYITKKKKARRDAEQAEKEAKEKKLFRKLKEKYERDSKDSANSIIGGLASVAGGIRSLKKDK